MSFQVAEHMEGLVRWRVGGGGEGGGGALREGIRSLGHLYIWLFLFIL